jgi:hypothetical protein
MQAKVTCSTETFQGSGVFLADAWYSDRHSNSAHLFRTEFGF